MRFLLRVVVNAFAIWIVTLIPWLMVSVIPFAPGGTLQAVLTFLVVAALFAIVNTVVGTVIRIVAFPLYIVTLGLISLIVNGILLSLTAYLTTFFTWGLRVEDFWRGVVAALLISVINWFVGVLVRPREDDRRR